MRSVLVAEDNPALRGLYRLWLEGEGFLVTEAADGREAIRLLEAGPLPDAAVLDVDMPYVDGVSLCRYLRLRSRTMRIVIVSGVRPVAPEANAILAKPCSHEQLLAALVPGWKREGAAGRARARRRAGVPLERR
jgi:two-component system, OmpR family, response regulator MprA